MKLPYICATGKNETQIISHRYTENGYEGIYNAIRDFAFDREVGEFYPYLLIQPKIAPKNEYKIACFNGYARFKVTSICIEYNDILSLLSILVSFP